MDNSLKKSLSEIITEHVINTFNVTFNVKVDCAYEAINSFNDDDLVSKIELSEGDRVIVMRFCFPRALFSPLLINIYGEMMAAHETVLEDAVCEVSNMVCSGLKTHLNTKLGYDFVMHFPKIDCDHHKKTNTDEEYLNIDFVLQNDGFSIDLNVLTKKIFLDDSLGAHS